MNEQELWWQTGIIYQIYPRSFQDSNGDGVGDLPGILERVDYLERLQVDAVWLSPIYPSPMHDFGYDVADYRGIHPLFGTLADLDRLLEALHARGMKLILDLVPNHTSSEHAWFQESRSSRDNAKHDWYIWSDPAPDGGPPNNWLSFFGGPAWTYDETRGQYYLHQFAKQQPELNYRNPEVLPAMLDNMRFWLDRGVDGFRVDVIWLLLKDPLLRDEPADPAWDGITPHHSLLHVHTQNVDGVLEIVQEMRAVLDEYDERMMVGEIYLPLQQLMAYYGGARANACHLPYNFLLINAPWRADAVRETVEAYEAALPEGAWPNWVLGNHDQKRVATRIGQAQARVANMLLLTLRGTPTTYYGEEIGMENVAIPPERLMDPPAVNQKEIADVVGRDPSRTPMQWSAAPNAGFTTPERDPWLPVAPDYVQRNVARQLDDPQSMLHLYLKLAALRRAEPALRLGQYQSVESGAPEVYAYMRTHAAERFLMVLNLSEGQHALDFSDLGQTAQIAVATDMVRSGTIDLAELDVEPNQGLVLRLGPEGMT